MLYRTEGHLFAKLGQSDSCCLNTRTPALTYGLRGLSYYKLSIAGPARDLHSGVFGHTVHSEPMTDLISLLGTLISPQGDILVKWVDEMVDAADADERDIKEATGASIALSADKMSVRMGRMRSPQFVNPQY